MSLEKIQKCDICETTRSSLKPTHWTDQICPVRLSMKNHISNQTIPFDGDACAECAQGMGMAIAVFIESRKKARTP